MAEVSRVDLNKARNAPTELENDLHYGGGSDDLELCTGKVCPREFIDQEFKKSFEAVSKSADYKKIAKVVLPTLQKVRKINQDGDATVYKANELMETVDEPLQYCYAAEEYSFELEKQARQILKEYDGTFKEMVIARKEINLELSEQKTDRCFRLLERAIEAAERDVTALEQVSTEESKRTSMEDIEETNSEVKHLIREENEELEIIKQHCKADISDIGKKLLDVEEVMNSENTKRSREQDKLKSELTQNQNRQRDLEEQLRQLRAREEVLEDTIHKNDQTQEKATEEHLTCQRKVKAMEDKIKHLLHMATASEEIMKHMSDCTANVVDTARSEKQRLDKDIKQKRVDSNLQLRDALLAKAVLHSIQINEAKINLENTKDDLVEEERVKTQAAKGGNRKKVERITERIGELKDEQEDEEKKIEHNRKHLQELEARLVEVDKKLKGMPLATLSERTKEWKAMQDKCFDAPKTAQFDSNISGH